jgi:hypothetical protein
MNSAEVLLEKILLHLAKIEHYLDCARISENHLFMLFNVDRTRAEFQELFETLPSGLQVQIMTYRKQARLSVQPVAPPRRRITRLD